MTNPPTTVFVSKNALTSGIKEREVVKFDSDGGAWVKTANGPFGGRQMRPRQWHLTREAAVARAEAMRVAELEALERQAVKLRAMVF